MPGGGASPPASLLNDCSSVANVGRRIVTGGDTDPRACPCCVDVTPAWKTPRMNGSRGNPCAAWCAPVPGTETAAAARRQPSRCQLRGSPGGGSKTDGAVQNLNPAAAKLAAPPVSQHLCIPAWPQCLERGGGAGLAAGTRRSPGGSAGRRAQPGQVQPRSLSPFPASTGLSALFID